MPAFPSYGDARAAQTRDLVGKQRRYFVRPLPLLMFGELAPGMPLVLGVVVTGDGGAGVRLDAAGGVVGCTPGDPAMPAGPETPAAP